MKRIAFTGGPGGGKTTAIDLLRRELGDRFVPLPEAATLLFLNGFPRATVPPAVSAAQEAIFRVQRSFEDIHAALYPDRTLLCDRGTVDGAAYWPEGPEGFFRHLGTTLEAELGRYSAVLFFETAAAGGLSIAHGNRARTESIAEAVAIDGRLRALWSKHPRFYLVPHHASFFHKMEDGLRGFRRLLEAP